MSAERRDTDSEADDPAPATGHAAPDEAGIDDAARSGWGYRMAAACCAALVAIMAVWEVGEIPLKAWLITHPTLSSVITTDPVAEVDLGARAAGNHQRALWLPLVWALASISTLKWHLVAFWAGRLWGEEALRRWSASGNPRRLRWQRRLTTLATRWPVLGVVLSYILMPVSVLIFAALGAGGLTWRRLLRIDIVVAMLVTFGWMYLGFYMGAPAVNLLDQYSRFAVWVAVSLAVLLAGWLGYRFVTREARRIKAEERVRAQEAARARIAEARLARKQARAAGAAALRSRAASWRGRLTRRPAQRHTNPDPPAESSERGLRPPEAP